MKKILLVDIKQKIKQEDFYNIIQKLDQNNIYITLTPYSCFLLDMKEIKYQKFHSFISEEKFRINVLSLINELNDKLPKDYNPFMVEFIKLSSSISYKLVLKEIVNKYNKNNIIYITDTIDNLYDNTNKTSYIYDFLLKNIQIDNSEQKNPLNLKLKKIKFNQIKNKFLEKIYNLKVEYDWRSFLFELSKYRNKKYAKSKKLNAFKKKVMVDVINKTLLRDEEKQFFLSFINHFFLNNKTSENEYLSIKFMTWKGLSNTIEASNNYSLFYQHGNYLYQNMIFQYAEIEPANINFVFNDYTKKLFEDLGAKKVYSVGSIFFNKPIKERSKKYDFLYITQGHDYTGNLQYVDFPNSLHSFDGYKLYQKHKNIIELFGKRFKDKSIVIRVHPTVITTGVYVPFWELAEPYANITIDVSIPIHNLIEETNYIISDYFTTEFINRELHYKRDIILFKGEPTPLPKETVADMEKMFLLVDTVDDLADKVKNIKNITVDRKRYNDIIEYYSSKNCDTKKVVSGILKKELDGR